MLIHFIMHIDFTSKIIRLKLEKFDASLQDDKHSADILIYKSKSVFFGVCSLIEILKEFLAR